VQEYLKRLDTNQTVPFIGLIAWASKAGIEEWYQDFAHGSESYERLGHIIDALRIICGPDARLEYRVLTMRSHLRVPRWTGKE
jgi:hypothetical protein